MNNIAEFILKISREGAGQGQAMAVELSNVDRAALQLTQTLMQTTAAQAATGAGAGALEPHLVNATGGFRQMHMVATTVGQLFTTGLSPGTMLNVGRGLAYIATSGAGMTAALSGGTFLAVSAALALVGLAFEKSKEKSDAAKKAAEEYAKTLKESGDATKAFYELLSEGVSPGRKQFEDLRVKNNAANAEDTKKLLELQKQLATVTARPDQDENKTLTQRVGLMTLIADLQDRIQQRNDATLFSEMRPTAETLTGGDRDFNLQVEAKRRLIELAKNDDAEYSASLDAQVKERSLTDLQAFDLKQTKEKESYIVQQALLGQIADAYAQRQTEMGALQDKKRQEAAADSYQKTLDEKAKLDSANRVREDKAPGDRSALVRTQTETEEKVKADLRLMWARSIEDKELELHEQFLQKRTALEKELKRPLTTGESGQLDNQEMIAVGMEQFAAAMQLAGNAAAIYQQKIDAVNKGMTAGTISSSEGARQIMAYKAGLDGLVKQSVPNLEALIKALKTAGVNTAVLEKEMADFKKKSAGAFTFAEQARAEQNFFKGMKMGFEELKRAQLSMGQVGVEVAKKIADGMTNTVVASLDALITKSESVSDAFKRMLQKMLMSLIEYIVGVIVEALILTVILSLIEKIPIVGPAVVSIIGDIASGDFASNLTDIASFDEGGPVTATGPALVHQGEFVIPHPSSPLYQERLTELMQSRAVAPAGVAALANGGFTAAARDGAPRRPQRTKSPPVVVLIGNEEIKKFQANPESIKAFKAQVVVHASHIQNSLDKKRGYKQ